MEIIKKIFQSSEGKGLAKRWESFFAGIIPTLVLLSQIFDWGIVKADFNELNGIVVTVISLGVALWQALEHLYGWIRRNAYKRSGQGKFAK